MTLQFTIISTTKKHFLTDFVYFRCCKWCISFQKKDFVKIKLKEGNCFVVRFLRMSISLRNGLNIAGDDGLISGVGSCTKEHLSGRTLTPMYWAKSQLRSKYFWSRWSLSRDILCWCCVEEIRLCLDLCQFLLLRPASVQIQSVTLFLTSWMFIVSGPRSCTIQYQKSHQPALITGRLTYFPFVAGRHPEIRASVLFPGFAGGAKGMW